KYGTTYQVHLSSDIKSQTGDSLASIPEWSFKTEIKISDRDNDGLGDEDEINLYFTDPDDSDTDGDGLNDYAEILAGLDPTNDADVAANNDPLYNLQWHLENTGHQFVNTIDGEDVNVSSVWGTYAGTPDMVVTVVDSGIEASHSDLKDNLDLSSSYNYAVSKTEPADPTPTPAQLNDNQIDSFHGTACAGLIAARGWNDEGLRGVAPFVRLAGLNVFSTGADEDFYDALGKTYADISSNSWGPGSWDLMEYPDIDAIEQGILLGRNGKGTIYVFAAGNDNFNANTSSNVHSSRFVITVTAVNAMGFKASYANYGFNILISAPGGELATYKREHPAIVTTDYTGLNYGYDISGLYHFNVSNNENGDYTDQMDGTSAATPIISGVVALVLQANPDLTYRDVKY
ncbi:MAG: S8 family serine peptidase, partial [Proteobacteria bacterium]|nr:S8 family serine peptidase [Pseudomonadota bacterium]